MPAYRSPAARPATPVESDWLATLPGDHVTWGLGSFAAAAVVIVLGNTSLQEGENGGTVSLIVSLIVCATAAGLLYGWIVPGTARPARTGLIVGIVTLITVVVFWSGLPIVVGSAAVVVTRRSVVTTPTRVVVVLAGVAAAATLVLGVVAGVLDHL